MYGAAMVGHCQPENIIGMGMEHTHRMGSEHIPERTPETLPQNLEMGTMKPLEWV